MLFREDKDVSKPSKQTYVDGLNALLEARQKQAKETRKAYCKHILENQEQYRADLKAMFGWPLTEPKPQTPPAVTTEKLAEEDGYTIFRMSFEILDGLFMTGLLFRANGEEKKPLVIAQHGGLGTPEFLSGMYGDTANYNDMLQRIVKQDVHAFAPQLLLWSDDYEVPFDRKELDARLKRVGSSITAIEVYGIMRILDYFEAQDYTDRLGMIGMSYGGFYTLCTSALDTRIEAAISCAFFNQRDCVGWSDWTWWRSAEKFDDAEIACLTYPRKLWIEIADNDELFVCERGKEAFKQLKEMCREAGTDWVKLIVFEGNHEFCKDDEPIRQLVEYLKR